MRNAVIAAYVVATCFVATCVVASCSLVNDYRQVPQETDPSGGAAPGGGGSGGLEGGAGAGGMPLGCVEDLCLAASTECTRGECVGDTVCNLEPLEVGLVCSAGYCDGGGSCAECLDNAKYGCPMSLFCDDKTCVPANCTDSVLNGTETDIDCGGADCGPCSVGQGCDGPSDCVSRHCVASQCDNCSTHAECGANAYCHPGSHYCELKKRAFFSCVANYECLSNVCQCAQGVCACAL